MSERLSVDAPTQLLSFLRQRLQGWSRATIKDRLRGGCVQVNGATTTAHDHPLLTDDEVLVHSKAMATVRRPAKQGFVTLYEDSDLIVIDKPAGLLSVATNKETERTALALVRESLTAPHARGRATVWPVHRLDRETSGVLLFATSHDLCKELQRGWSSALKTYLAIVLGQPDPPEGVIDEPLWEDPSLQVHVGRRPTARDARTRYKTQEVGSERTLLEVGLETGRRHQIRAHLAWLGNPVVGDKRYKTGGLAPRMGLHALRLDVRDPRTGTRLSFESPPDPEFLALLRGSK